MPPDYIRKSRDQPRRPRKDRSGSATPVTITTAACVVVGAAPGFLHRAGAVWLVGAGTGLSTAEPLNAENDVVRPLNGGDFLPDYLLDVESFFFSS